VPSRKTGRRGDLVLEVQLVLPPVIDARGRELMQEFARLHPENVRAGWFAGGNGDAVLPPTTPADTVTSAESIETRAEVEGQSTWSPNGDAHREAE